MLPLVQLIPLIRNANLDIELDRMVVFLLSNIMNSKQLVIYVGVDIIFL